MVDLSKFLMKIDARAIPAASGACTCASAWAPLAHPGRQGQRVRDGQQWDLVVVRRLTVGMVARPGWAAGNAASFYN